MIDGKSETMSNGIEKAGADPSTATADIELDDGYNSDDVTIGDMIEDNTVTIELDPMYARMLHALREEHGDRVDENLEQHVHGLISDSYLENRD